MYIIPATIAPMATDMPMITKAGVENPPNSIIKIPIMTPVHMIFDPIAILAEFSSSACFFAFSAATNRCFISSLREILSSFSPHSLSKKLVIIQIV